MNKTNLLYFLIFLSVFAGLIFGYNLGKAYAELEINTTITDDIIIISGFFDEDSIGIALKLDGRLIDTARGPVEFGHYFIEMQNPGPGTYELLVGSATNNKSVEIIIGIEPEVQEIEIEDLPYAGNVGPIEIELSMEPIESEIPAWVKDVFVMWADGYISDSELINSIEYLVQIGVIEL